ncbi:hypothetical protein BH23BAC3_BH23BAC3_02620 [soil metagenome]
MIFRLNNPAEPAFFLIFSDWLALLRSGSVLLSATLNQQLNSVYLKTQIFTTLCRESLKQHIRNMSVCLRKLTIHAISPTVFRFMNLLYGRFYKSLSLSAALILIFLTGFLNAQQLHTYVDRDSIRVGDTFTLSVVLDGNFNLLSYPDDEHFPDDLELQNRQRFQVSATRDSIVYTLQFFGVEDIVIDPMEFQIRAEQQDTTLLTSRVPLFFKTTLTEEDDQLRPLKPIFDFARSYWPFLVGFVLLALIAYLVYRLLKDRARKETFIPTPYQAKTFVNPVDELEKSIHHIASQPAPKNEHEFEQFYIQLGDAIRLYLKRVYEFPALEMTSGEIVRKLQEQRASADLIKKVKKVLYDADMVKFARFNPASDQVADAIKTGTEFITTARTIDSERIGYLEHLHKKEQKDLQAQHELKEQKRKQEFEQ